ncbi:hypothetical protein AR687_16510 [Flavobacteriaceae bacterium CRH]|nr:hypothetical protein AR687_16510 [Flavobacteriaceae bacterium CRH]
MKIKDFPHFYQTGNNDCGHTCVRIIASYYGIKPGEDLKITDDQLSIYEIISLLNSMGVQAKALELKSSRLLQTLNFPYLALMNNKHYVIVYNKTNDYYFISDPKRGNIKVLHHNFEMTLFNNENPVAKIVTLERQAVRNDGANTLKFSSLLLHFFKKIRKKFNRLLVLILVITILQALTPFFFRAIIDLGINKNNLSIVNILVIANFILIIGIGLGNTIKEILSMTISEEFKYNLMQDYLKKTLNSLSILNQLKVGQILKKIKDIETVNNFITNNSVYFITSCLLSFIYLIILLMFDSLIFGVFLTGVIIYIIWQLSFTSYLKLLENDSRFLQIKERNFWSDTINSIYDVKAYNAEHTQISSWESVNKDLHDNVFKDLKVKNIQQFGNHLINGGQRLLILYFCVTKVFNGEMTFGTMISIQFIVGFMSTPINSIIAFTGQYVNFKMLLNYVEADHNLFKQNSLPDALVDVNNIEVIQFYNSSLLYQNTSVPALLDINFKIYKGRKYAFVGKSGSGKSSFLKLILGLYGPSDGRMEVNNISISEIDPASYREHFSVMLQESRLIEGTFIDNITYKAERTDFEFLNEVVKLANLDDILTQYDKGIFSVINNNAQGLSDGQKQRILIARALYRYREFLVLDEPTSSLDPYNKHVIFENIIKKFEGRTMLVATHDMNLIKDFDVIVVLNKGKIVEAGNHENLMKKRGFYSVLYNIQNKSNL